MNNQHPIKPTLKQVERWFGDAVEMMSFATAAVQWGADQQLDACCEWISCDCQQEESADRLRNACRPKRRRTSLKEEALELLNAVCASAGNGDTIDPTDLFVLRDALEALPNE